MLQRSSLAAVQLQGFCSGAPGSVGTTPIHPELGGEKAEGITELDGQLSGIVILVPESPFTFGLIPR